MTKFKVIRAIIDTATSDNGRLEDACKILENYARKTEGDLIQELRTCRSNLSCLIDKAWELGGYCAGEKGFEQLNDVKDAREQIERINELERKFHKTILEDEN